MDPMAGISPDFRTTLQQLVVLKEHLLQQHEGQVGKLRGECDRLRKDLSRVRFELAKANEQLLATPPTSPGRNSHGNSHEHMHTDSSAALTEPPAAHMSADALQAAARSSFSRPDSASFSLPGIIRYAEAEQVSRSRSTSDRGHRNASKVKPKMATMTASSTWPQATDRASSSSTHEAPGLALNEVEGCGRQLQRPGSCEDSQLDAASVSQPGPAPTHLQMYWSAEGSPREHRNSGGGARVNSADSCGSMDHQMVGSTTSRRGSMGRASSAESMERFVLRDTWKENMNLLHSSTKTWRAVTISHLQTRPKKPLGISLSWKMASSWNRAPRRLSVLHPASRIRLLWDLLSLVLVIYDIVVVPMRPFDWPPEATAGTTDWIGRVFWTSDIAVSFATGVYTNFELEMRFREVAKHYAKTWMPFDIVVVASQWIPLAIGEDGSESETTRTTLNVVRLLRFARLLRLLKVEMVLENFGAVFNSQMAWRLRGVVRLFLYFSVGIHVVACGWFWVGSSVDGWVARENVEAATIDYQYLISIHWTLSQLHGASEVAPGSGAESLFAIAILFLGVASLCFLVSYAVCAMLRLEQSHHSSTKQHLLLLAYLRKNHISRALSVSVKKCFDVHMHSRAQESDALEAKEALACLPLRLQIDMAEEIRRPVAIMYGFLSDIDEDNPRVVRQLVHDCCLEKAVRPLEIVFTAGDACASMIFVVGGEFMYSIICQPNSPMRTTGFGPVESKKSNMSRKSQLKKSASLDSFGSSSGKVSDDDRFELSMERGTWVSEATLWTKWENLGEFRAVTGGELLLLDALQFASVISSNYVGACAYAVKYGRKFVEWLQVHDSTALSDVMDFRIRKDDLEQQLQEASLLERESERALEMESWRAEIEFARAAAAGSVNEKGEIRRWSKARTMQNTNQHHIFVSHHKAGGGTEAALMQEALERLIEQDSELSAMNVNAPVFLDSEDLSDLTDLKSHVRNSCNLVLLLTEEVLKRPWVLVEIVTAHTFGVHIVPVEIQKRDDNKFKYPDDAFYKNLREGDFLSASEERLLQDEGIEVEELEKALRHVFKKIAVPFSPHKSALVREAELRDILRRCTVGAATSTSHLNPSEVPSLKAGGTNPMPSTTTSSSIGSTLLPLPHPFGVGAPAEATGSSAKDGWQVQAGRFGSAEMGQAHGGTVLS